MKRLEKPIFVGGCGSSGTTLLRKMLNMHPNIAAGPELSVFDRPHFYEMKMTLFYTLWRSNDFDVLDELCEFPLRVNPSNKSYFAWNRDQYHDDETWEKFFNEVETPVELFDHALSAYAAKHDKKRWCEKTPNNIFCVDQILKAFPDAVFIEMVRDGRDAVMSLVNRRGQHPMISIYRWIAAIKAGLKIKDNNLSTNDKLAFTTITYEDLVQTPAWTLREICEFIGEDYDPIMLQYWRKKYNTEKEVNDLGYGKKPVFTSSVGKWKKRGVNPTLQKMMKLTMSDLLEQLGYEV
jgi:hypothetical protein